MKAYAGKRVIVTIGDNDTPRQTTVRAISPNGCYCLLDGPLCSDSVIGWIKCDSVRVLDVLGNVVETESDLMKRLSY